MFMSNDASHFCFSTLKTIPVATTLTRYLLICPDMIACVYFAVALSLIGLSSGQGNAQCRGTVGPGMITPAHFFDVDRMMGTWYLKSAWVGEGSEVFAPEGRCTAVEFVRQEPLVINSTETYFNITAGQDMTTFSELRIDTTLPLQSTWAPYLNNVKVSDFVWVQTTYEDWAMSYACSVNADGVPLETMYLIVRNPERELDEFTFGILKFIAKGYGFRNENMLPIDNSSC